MSYDLSILRYYLIFYRSVTSQQKYVDRISMKIRSNMFYSAVLNLH